MRELKHPSYIIIYPDDKSKKTWDIVLVGMLMFTCIATPARMAFDDETDIHVAWTIVDVIVDIFFTIDIFVNFFSAYYDGEY